MQIIKVCGQIIALDYNHSLVCSFFFFFFFLQAPSVAVRFWERSFSGGGGGGVGGCDRNTDLSSTSGRNFKHFRKGLMRCFYFDGHTRRFHSPS